MSNLDQQLEEQLSKLTGIELSFYKDTDLLTMYYQGKEIAHFHRDPLELDIRIPKPFAKRHALGEPHQSPKHPDRSKNSIWRSLPCNRPEDVNQIVSLVEKLVVEEYS